MSDGVKQKRPIHCPLFYRGLFISYAGIANCKDLLSLYSRELFLKFQHVQWIC
jgi:hypothetical protein